MRVLITGSTGLIASHLIDLLVADGDTVYGLDRRQRPLPREGVTTVYGDLLSQSSLIRALEESQPEVIAHLGAVTSIGPTWSSPELVMDTNAVGTLRLLEAIRIVNPRIRLVNAATADQFGDWPYDGTEDTPFSPRSPYAIAKQGAYDFCETYKEAYGLCVSSLIQYNCTSERQGPEFIVPKVCDGARAGARITLGRLTAQRDWTDARDHARAWKLAGELTVPGNFVIASGITHSIRELCETAYGAVGLDWTQYVHHDPSITRPTDTDRRRGWPLKARHALGWQAETSFDDLVKRLVGPRSWSRS